MGKNEYPFFLFQVDRCVDVDFLHGCGNGGNRDLHPSNCSAVGDNSEIGGNGTKQRKTGQEPVASL